MAALTSSGVTVHDSWVVGETRKFKVVEVSLVLSAQGDLTDNIPASLFGMVKITKAWGFRTTSSVRAEFGPNLSSTLNGTLLVYYNNQQATDANRDNPATVTGTFRGFIEGIPTTR